MLIVCYSFVMRKNPVGGGGKRSLICGISEGDQKDKSHELPPIDMES